MMVARLTYEPEGGISVPVGATSDPRAVRALAGQLLRDAEAEVQGAADRTVAALKVCDAEALRGFLEHLRLVEPAG